MNYAFPEGALVMEESLRRMAIRRYVLGNETPKQIYGGLNRSKKWFFKWLKRYHTAGMDWYKDKKTIRRSLDGMTYKNSALYGSRQEAGT
jgi:hypothetical protein